MNPTLNALLVTLLWSCTDEHGDPLDSEYSPSDVCKKDAEKLYKEFQAFLEIVEPQINAIAGDGWDCIDDFYDRMQPSDSQAEHDYIMTRNRKGVGFWDGDWSESVSDILTKAAQSQPEIVACVGDDNKIYLY